MITSSGAKCDVCGKYILPINPEERVNEFSIRQAPGQIFHCDNECKKILLKIGNNWRKLPPGPLRTAYEDVTAWQKKQDEHY